MEKVLEGIGYAAVLLLFITGVSLLFYYETILQEILKKVELEFLWKSLADFGS